MKYLKLQYECHLNLASFFFFITTVMNPGCEPPKSLPTSLVRVHFLCLAGAGQHVVSRVWSGADPRLLTANSQHSCSHSDRTSVCWQITNNWASSPPRLAKLTTAGYASAAGAEGLGTPPWFGSVNDPSGQGCLTYGARAGHKDDVITCKKIEEIAALLLHTLPTVTIKKASSSKKCSWCIVGYCYCQNEWFFFS